MKESMGVRATSFFDDGGLKEVFEHVRNAVFATILVAAGLQASHRTGAEVPAGWFSPLIAGYVVAGIGIALILLNFVDGWRRLAKLQWHFAFQVGLAFAYLFGSYRVVQIIVLMRTGFSGT